MPEPEPAADPARRPSISVAICTRDRPVSLLETLDSVWRQSPPPDEIVVIDDGRLDDAVRTRIAEQCRAIGIAFQCRSTDQPGLTAGRNLAARAATGDVLLYLDDDVTCQPGLIDEVAQLTADHAIAGLSPIIDEPTFARRSTRFYQLGYAIAGWWSVRPRSHHRGPRPAVLSDPSRARPLRHLSGAAMALRRSIVLAHPFDESLTRYALGEDREMSYRLAPRNWLIEARRIRVTHRRDASGRADPHRMGYCTTYNYLHILRRTCRLGPGDCLLVGWTFFVLAMLHLLWALLGRHRADHFAELRGMIDGLLAAPTDGKTSAARPRTRERSIVTNVRPAPVRRISAQPRRVLFVTNRLEPGGAERMLVSLASHLPSLGIQPSIVCLKDAGPLAPACRQQGIPVHEDALRFKTDAAVLLRLRRIIEQERIDVLVAAHSGGDRMFWSTLAGTLIERPVVVWSHWFPGPGARHFERANRALFRCVDCYVALGQPHRLALIRHEHVPAGRIAVIPNGIDLGPFKRLPSRAEARAALGLRDEHFGVGIVANLRREKRHDVFIEAAARLAPRHPSMRFLIVGDGPHRDAVQRAAAASGLSHEVLRLLGSRDDVPAVLAGLDVSCLCSEKECFSVSMLEAAAAGSAFVGPDAGCLPEFLVDAVTGLLIPPADGVALIDAIERLAADSSLRARLINEARRRVFDRWGIERMAAAFADLLHGCQRRGRRPPALPTGSIRPPRASVRKASTAAP